MVRNENEGFGDLKEAIEYRRRVDEDILRAAKKTVKNAPKGKLHIHGKKNYVQFGIVKNGGKEIYLSNKSTLPGKLAQRDYNELVIKSIERELRLMDSLEKGMTSIEDIFLSQNKWRQNLIKPYVLSDEQYKEEWLGIGKADSSFKEIAEEYYTGNGIRVRSKSEMAIGNMLEKYDIPYKYEAPIRLGGVLFHPDFTVLNLRKRKEYYWEHLGMMSDYSYANNAVKKLETYNRAGIYVGESLLLTMESDIYHINLKTVKCLIEKYLL